MIVRLDIIYLLCLIKIAYYSYYIYSDSYVVRLLASELKVEDEEPIAGDLSELH